jgi:hypothetical protein
MKFEYMTVFITFDDDSEELENFVASVNGEKVKEFISLHKFLKKYGAKGWEVCCSVYPDNRCLILKRQKG